MERAAMGLGRREGQYQHATIGMSDGSTGEIPLACAGLMDLSDGRRLAYVVVPENAPDEKAASYLYSMLTLSLMAYQRDVEYEKQVADGLIAASEKPECPPEIVVPSEA
jgi:hypothetical protein